MNLLEVKIIFYKHDLFDYYNLKHKNIEISKEPYSEIFKKDNLDYIDIYTNEYELGVFLLENHRDIINLSNEYREIMQRTLKTNKAFEVL